MPRTKKASESSVIEKEVKPPTSPKRATRKSSKPETVKPENAPQQEETVKSSSSAGFDFTVYADEFWRVLCPLQRSLQLNEETYPVLANVMLTVQNGEVKLSATNLAVSVSVKIDSDTVEIENEGSYTFPLGMLVDLFEFLEGPIALAEIDGFLEIKSGCGEYRILGIPSTQFPSSRDIQDMDIATKIAPSFYDFLKPIIAANKFTSPAKRLLSGVMVAMQGDRLTFYASDGHRAIRCGNPTPNPDLRFTIPSKIVTALEQFWKYSDSVEIAISRDDSIFLHLETDGAAIEGKLIGGNYPNLEPIFPDRFEHEISFNAQKLKETMKRLWVFIGNEEGVNIRLHVDPKAKEIAIADASGRYSFRESISAEIIGDPISINFGFQYFKDFLDLFGSDLTIKMNSPTAIAVFCSKNYPEITGLLMPVQYVD